MDFDQLEDHCSRPLIERAKEHLSGRTAVSDYIINWNNCKNKNLSINHFENSKESKNKIETLISQAILIKRYNPTLIN